MKLPRILLLKIVSVLITVVMLSVPAKADLLAQDLFTDGGRTDGTDALDLAWYTETTTPSTTLTVTDDSSGIGSGYALRFTPTGTVQGAVANLLSTVTLNDGDSIRLTFDWRYAGTTNQNQANLFRFGLYNNNGTPTTADLQSNRTDDVGYFFATNPGAASSTGSTLYRETAGTEITQSTDVTALGSSGPSIVAGITVHTVEFTITRVGATLKLVSSLDGQVPTAATDASPVTYTFNEIALLSAGASIPSGVLIDNVQVERFRSIMNSTFTAGVRTVTGPNGPDAAFWAIGTPTLAIANDSTGIADGNALQITPTAASQGVVASLPFPGIVNLKDGDSVALSFVWRFTGTTGLTAADILRFGLYNNYNTPTVKDNDTTTLTRTNDTGYFTKANLGSGTPGHSIGIQFQGTGTALLTTDSAGFLSVAQTNWNVLTGNSFTNRVLSDSSGTTTAVTITGSAAGTFHGGASAAPPVGNSKLSSGELYNGWPGGSTFTVANIPYASYDVYVYAAIDASGRAETVRLTPAGGSSQYYSFSTTGGGSAWILATSTWNGSGTQPTLPSANYVKYTGITTSSFSLNWGAPSNGGLNAIQIVPTPPAPASTTVNRETAGTEIMTGADTSVLGTAGISVAGNTAPHTAELKITRSGSSLIVQSTIDGLTHATGTDASPLSFAFNEIGIQLAGITSPLIVDDVRVEYSPASFAALVQTIGTGSTATPAVGPAPAYGLGGAGCILVKNWDFGSNGTITNNTDLIANFQFHDQHGLAANPNYGSDMVAPTSATAISGQPYEGKLINGVAVPTVRSYFADYMQTYIVPLGGVTTLTASASPHNAGSGSFQSKWDLPSAGSYLGKDLIWETRVRYVTPPYFWFALWNSAKDWQTHLGPEIDLMEAFGYNNGGTFTNYTGRYWHSNAVGGSDTVNYSNWGNGMSACGITTWDATQYHTWTLVYRANDTYACYVDGIFIQGGSSPYIWNKKPGSMNPGVAQELSFQFDALWGSKTVTNNNFPLAVSALAGTYYEWDYSRVYLK